METEEDAAPCRTEVENVKKGPEGVPEDVLPVLLLFCAAYSHLLVVLDDEEFYDHQVVGQCGNMAAWRSAVCAIWLYFAHLFCRMIFPILLKRQTHGHTFYFCICLE